jgi:hypothetical protein
MKRYTRLAPYCLGYVPSNKRSRIESERGVTRHEGTREHSAKLTCCLHFGFDFGSCFPTHMTLLLFYTIVPPRH